jgi:hypothetical protein
VAISREAWLRAIASAEDARSIAAMLHVEAQDAISRAKLVCEDAERTRRRARDIHGGAN